ncbi:hypothetical protein AAG906_030728 [Vitis piasezkii]
MLKTFSRSPDPPSFPFSYTVSPPALSPSLSSLPFLLETLPLAGITLFSRISASCPASLKILQDIYSRKKLHWYYPFNTRQGPMGWGIQHWAPLARTWATHGHGQEELWHAYRVPGDHAILIIIYIY